jgi:hypothetical protein
VSCEEWEKQRAELHAISEDYGVPIDPLVEDAVIGLRCLGFPTFGSCQGHIEPETYPDGQSAQLYPHIGIRRRFLPSRFVYGWEPGEFISPLWVRRVRGNERERHYMAHLAWNVYRPMRDRLLVLLEEFRVESGRSQLLFRVKADWTGVDIEPHEQPGGPWIETTNANLARYHAELIALGVFLKRRVCSDT